MTFYKILDQIGVLFSRFWQKNRYILQVDFIEPKSKIKSVPESPWTFLCHEVNIPGHFTNIFYGSKKKFWGGCLSHAVQMTLFLSPNTIHRNLTLIACSRFEKHWTVGKRSEMITSVCLKFWFAGFFNWPI